MFQKAPKLIHRLFRARYLRSKPCVTKSSGMGLCELLSVNDAENRSTGVDVSIVYFFHQNSDLHPSAHLHTGIHLRLHLQPDKRPSRIQTQNLIHSETLTHPHPHPYSHLILVYTHKFTQIQAQILTHPPCCAELSMRKYHTQKCRVTVLYFQ